MTPDQIIAGAEVGSNVAGGIIGNILHGKRTKQAHQRNIELWNMQNAYNHPSAQMARLKEAGLNPRLMYGKGATASAGNAGAIAPTKAASVEEIKGLEGLGRYFDYSVKKEQTNNLKRQNDVLIQDALYRAVQTAESIERTSSSKQMRRQSQDLHKISLEAAEQNVNQVKKQNVLLDIEARVKDERHAKDMLLILENIAIARETLYGKRLENAIKGYEEELRNRYDIMPNDPWYLRMSRKMGETLKGFYESFNYKSNQGSYRWDPTTKQYVK